MSRVPRPYVKVSRRSRQQARIGAVVHRMPRVSSAGYVVASRVQSYSVLSRARYAPNSPGRHGGDLDHWQRLLSQFPDPPVNPGLL